MRGKKKEKLMCFWFVLLLFFIFLLKLFSFLYFSFFTLFWGRERFISAYKQLYFNVVFCVLSSRMTFPEVLDLNSFITTQLTTTNNKDRDGEYLNEDKSLSNVHVDSSDEGKRLVIRLKMTTWSLMSALYLFRKIALVPSRLNVFLFVFAFGQCL